jgi:hypothetical protein
LIALFLSSVVHYTDNYIRLDQYPQGDPPSITRMKVLVAWTAFTAFGAAGYLLYRKGKSLEAAGCIAIYSISGLISFLHYGYGSLSDFDVLQHTFILMDGLTGIAALGLAIWLARLRPSPV